jgi:hypothetical protein
MNCGSTEHGKTQVRTLTDKQFIINVVNKTTMYVGKKLLRTEIEGLVHYIKSVNFKLMKHDHPDHIVDKIAKNFTKQLTMHGGSIIDTHEVMKRQLGEIAYDDDESLYQDADCSPYHATNGIISLSGDSGQNSEYKTNQRTEGFGTRARNTDETNKKYENNLSINQQPLKNISYKYPRIAKQNIQNIYLLLDSKYRNLSTDNSIFNWTVLHSANTTQGTVNTLSDQIHNITNIQFDRFNIPYTSSADNIYKKISLYIEEFSSMSVLINSGRRYHMIFDSDVQGGRIILTPLINDEGRFRFHTPVNILDTITIKFQSPFSPVVFLKDRYNVIITSLSATQSILTFAEPHNVADGELVHLEDFDALGPKSNIDTNQINNVNREEGHSVVYINNLVLYINADISSVTLNPNNRAICFIASRRIIIPIRMEYIV